MLCSALAFELCFLSYASCKSHSVLFASIVSLGKQRSYRKAASNCPNDINISVLIVKMCGHTDLIV